MKKITLTIAISISSLMANARDMERQMDEVTKYRSINLAISIASLILAALIILIFIKLILDYRLKNKLIERSASDHMVSELLQTTVQESKNVTIKWFALLAGLGTGLLVVNYTQPLGIHSLAILSFSLAASFLGYYFFIRHQEKS